MLSPKYSQPAGLSDAHKAVYRASEEVLEKFRGMARHDGFQSRNCLGTTIAIHRRNHEPIAPGDIIDLDGVYVTSLQPLPSDKVVVNGHRLRSKAAWVNTGVHKPVVDGVRAKVGPVPVVHGNAALPPPSDRISYLRQNDDRVVAGRVGEVRFVRETNYIIVEINGDEVFVFKAAHSIETVEDAERLILARQKAKEDAQAIKLARRTARDLALSVEGYEFRVKPGDLVEHYTVLATSTDESRECFRVFHEPARDVRWNGSFRDLDLKRVVNVAGQHSADLHARCSTASKARGLPASELIKHDDPSVLPMLGVCLSKQQYDEIAGKLVGSFSPVMKEAIRAKFREGLELKADFNGEYVDYTLTPETGLTVFYDCPAILNLFTSRRKQEFGLLGAKNNGGVLSASLSEVPLNGTLLTKGDTIFKIRLLAGSFAQLRQEVDEFLIHEAAKQVVADAVVQHGSVYWLPVALIEGLMKLPRRRFLVFRENDDHIDQGVFVANFVRNVWNVWPASFGWLDLDLTPVSPEDGFSFKESYQPSGQAAGSRNQQGSRQPNTKGKPVA